MLFLKEDSFKLQVDETWISPTNMSPRKGLEYKIEPRWSDINKDDVDDDNVGMTVWREIRKESCPQPKGLGRKLFSIKNE